MKKISSILVLCCTIVLMLMSCKSDKNSEKTNFKQNDSLIKADEYPTLTGEFIHVDTAAVLKVKNKLYGVKMDDIAKSVIKEAENIKTDDYDVINVIIKAEINPNNETEGWEEIVTIKKLDKIYKPQQPAEETKVLINTTNKIE